MQDAHNVILIFYAVNHNVVLNTDLSIPVGSQIGILATRECVRHGLKCIIGIFYVI